MSHANIWGRDFQAEGTIWMGKDPLEAVCLIYSKLEKRPVNASGEKLLEKSQRSNIGVGVWSSSVGLCRPF